MLSFCPLAGAKKKALSGFLFLLLVTLFSGPGHAGNAENSGHGVDTHARVEGLGAALGVVGLGVGGGVVVVARRGIGDAAPLQGKTLGLLFSINLLTL